MTAHSISHAYLLTERDSNPFGCGFQNFSDVAGHVAKRADEFGLGDQQSSASRRLVDFHRGDVEVPVSYEQVSDCFEEHGRHVVAVSDLILTHCNAPLPKAANGHHITNAEKVTEEFENDSRNRHCVASCIETKQSAIIGTQVLQ